MQRTYYTLFSACTLILSSCNFSVGTKKDLNTGLSYSYNGFAVDEVLLVGPDNVAMTNNEAQLNTKLQLLSRDLQIMSCKMVKRFQD